MGTPLPRSLTPWLLGVTAPLPAVRSPEQRGQPVLGPLRCFPGGFRNVAGAEKTMECLTSISCSEKTHLVQKTLPQRPSRAAQGLPPPGTGCLQLLLPASGINRGQGRSARSE